MVLDGESAAEPCIVLFTPCCDDAAGGVEESLAGVRREPGGTIGGGEREVEADAFKPQIAALD